MENEKKVLTPYEVADITGLSLRLVYRQLRNGTIPNVKCGDKYLISKSKFYQWLDGQCQPVAR